MERITTKLFGSEQQLPIDTKIFWANKMKFQQFFIDWFTKNYSQGISLHLGASYHEDIIRCFKLSDGILTQHHLLKCDHKEADDRIMLHVNHAVKVDTFSKVVIAFSDIDVFVCALYYFSRCMYSGLHELRSSYRRFSLEKVVLRNFAKIHRKTPVTESLLTLLNKRLWYKCLPVSLAKLLRKPVLQTLRKKSPYS